jgi:pimeloyl-ACP methyl ester carboxylesterase
VNGVEGKRQKSLCQVSKDQMSDLATDKIQRHELRLDLNNLVPVPDAMMAATLVAPDDATGDRTVVFGFPGGGYNRAYFDLRHSLLDGPTEAEWHAKRGTIFIGFDPLGGGESTLLEPSLLTLEATIRVVHGVITRTVKRLREGTLVNGLPPIKIRKTIGIGHSLGGMQLIAQQGIHRTFDAVAILGFSAIHTVVPTQDGVLAPHGSTDTGEALDEAWAGPLADEIAHIRYCYHWEDVPSALVDEDMSAGFPIRKDGALPSWITRTFPPFAAICLSEGVVAKEAANIDVPVFVGAGERDVAPDVRKESVAYASSNDITAFEISRCAHMHNFSRQRPLLWRRLQNWVDGLSVD